MSDLRNIRVPDDLWQQAKEVAAASGTTVSQAIRNYLQWWVDAGNPSGADTNRPG